MHREDCSQKYLNYKEVCARYSICPTTLYRWVAEKRLPEGDKIGPRARRWNIDDLLKWEENVKKNPARAGYVCKKRLSLS